MTFVSYLARRSQSRSNLLLAVAIIATYVSLAVSALEVSLNIPTNHLDGAYQTASGLYRLAEGQWPGKDFFPYLGVGPLLLLYPLFALAGGHMAASVFASHIAASVTLTLVAGQIHYLVAQRNPSVLVSIGFGCMYCVVLAPFVAGIPGMDETFVRWGFVPGNSLRPVRAFLPFIAAFAMLLLVRSKQSAQRRSFVLALFAGGSTIWSNDYAYVTAAGLLLVALPPVLRQGWRETGMTLIAFALSATTIYFAATAGHPLDMLRYNFVDVAGDQWWYFGSWEEAYRIFSVGDLGRLVTPQWIFPAAATIVLGRRYRRLKRFEDFLLLWVGAILFAGGATASIGGHIDRYFDPVCQWGAIILISILVERLRDRAANLPTADSIQLARRGSLFIMAAFGASALASSLVSIYLERKMLASDGDGRIYVRELGGYLPPGWEGYVAQARSSAPAIVIEEYWGIFSAIRRVFPPWPVDSVIHALGSVRPIAEASLHNPDAMVIASRYPGPNFWQPWNVSANYWFYRPLIESGVIQGLSTSTVIFGFGEKRQFTPVPCTLGKSGDTFRLPGANPGYYEISLSFSVTGSGRYLLMADNRMVFAAGAAGNLSLDFRRTSALFPVYLDDVAYPDFSLELRPAATTRRLTLIGCEARKIDFSDSIVLPVPRPFTKGFFFTDENWDQGFSRKEAAFFMPNLARNREKIKVQHRVLLPNGEQRTITRVEIKGNLIIAYVDGSRLDSGRLGDPDNLKFVP